MDLEQLPITKFNYTVLVLRTFVEVVSMFAETCLEKVKDGESKLKICGRLKCPDSVESGIFLCTYYLTLLAFAIAAGCVFGNAELSRRETTTGVSGTAINIDGSAFAEVSGDSTARWNVWDPTDIAEPVSESDVFFTTTKRVWTPNQALGNCIGGDKTCRSDRECSVGVVFENGTFTGDCVSGYCSVLAWCPAEYDDNNRKAIVEKLYNRSLNFRILIRSHMYVEYPSDEEPGPSKSYTNIVKPTEDADGNKCKYDKDVDDKCPYFNLNYILDEATEHDYEKYDELIKQGGVVSIRLDWSCKTDNGEEHCPPTYHFKQLDKREAEFLDIGYSYTNAEYKYGTKERTFYRSTGILFIVQVDAKGYRDSVVKDMIYAASIFVIVSGAKPCSKVFATIFYCIYCCCCCCCKED